MVFVFGDLHGRADKVLNFAKKVALSENDTLVLLGDVGANYYGGIKDYVFKRKLNEVGAKILCIRGNHEMRPSALKSYHISSYCGGRVFVEDEFPNLLFAIDGEIFNLAGLNCIAIGGAYSVDKAYRIANNYGWWLDEQLSDFEKFAVEEQIASKKVDIVFSHTCPWKYRPTEMFISFIDQSTVDDGMERWLDTIEEKLDYTAWYCGHWHCDKHIDKMHFLFDSCELLEDIKHE